MVAVRLCQVLTVATKFQVQDIADLYVDYTEEALIASFEFALIEYLHSDNRGVLDGAMQSEAEKWCDSRVEIKGSHVEVLVPVRVESLLDNTRRMRLLGIDCNYREGVWETEDISLGEPICSNDYVTKTNSACCAYDPEGRHRPVILIFFLLGRKM